MGLVPFAHILEYLNTDDFWESQYPPEVWDLMRESYKERQPGVLDASANIGNSLADIGCRDTRGEAAAFGKIRPLLKSRYPMDPTWGLQHGTPEFEEARQKYFELLRTKGSDYPNDYGVADNVEQILEYYKEVLADPDRMFVIATHAIRRNPENKWKGGGWRWHKWGPYIGTQNPKCEYLDDEDDIDEVLCFHLFELDPEVYRAVTIETPDEGEEK